MNRDVLRLSTKLRERVEKRRRRNAPAGMDDPDGLSRGQPPAVHDKNIPLTVYVNQQFIIGKHGR